MSCNEIEDEYHVVMCCQKYTDLRKKFLPKYVYKRPSMLKFVELLNEGNKNCLKKLGIFAHLVFERYNNEEIYA